MDGISTAASVLTLVDLAREGFALRRRLINAPDEFERLLIRIDSLALETRILLETKDSFRDNDFETPGSRMFFRNCIEDTQKTIAKLRNVAEEAMLLPGWKGRIKWATLGKLKIETLMAELQQTEAGLTLILQLLQW
jgi:hypothetical protein